MTHTKLISYTIYDFSTEIEMESFLHLIENKEMNSKNLGKIG